ncbi:MAG: hypothetical protein ACW97X_08810, partial [Candidatus Hodarchaeales archaeon]
MVKLIKTICRNNSIRITIILWIVCFQIQTFYDLPILQQSDVEAHPTVSSKPALISNSSSFAFTKIPLITPKLLVDQDISILFIIGDESNIDPVLDEQFYNFTTINLSFSVTYHTANDSYNYTGFDAIIISNSVGTNPVGSLDNAPIPILTMEPTNFDDFHLGADRGATANYNSWILTSESHYILEDDIPGVKSIYTQKGTTHYLTGFDAGTFPIGCEVKQLAYHDSPSAIKYAALATVEKDALNYNLTRSKERRVFLGAASSNLYT